jgi:hypothetical protein
MNFRISRAWTERARLALSAGLFLLASLPAAAESLDPRTTWAVVAGVLEWRDPGLSPFPKEERKDRALFEKLGEIGVPAAQRTLLLDEEATAGAIAEALAGVVARAGQEATLIFYFAGHGVREDDGRIVFTSSDTRLDRLDRTGLEMGQLRRLLEGFRGKRLILLADCCHSGGLGEVAEALSGARQTVALTSSQASSISTGNWTFTQTLIDGFGGRALLDRDEDGALTFGELAAEVKEAMCHRERQRYGFASFGVPPGLVIARSKKAAAGAGASAGKSAELRRRDWIKAEDEEIGRILEVEGGRQGGRALVEFFDYSKVSQTWLPLESLEPDRLETWPASTELRVTWKQQVWDAKVREADGGFMLITYPGFDASWDEWIGADRVVGAKRQLPAAGDRVKVEWQGHWYDARVKSTRDGKWCVSYVGFDAKWDECVGETRLRF